MKHSMELIDHRKVDIQFSSHGDIMFVRCPFNAQFIAAVKSNLHKDGETYYEFNNKQRQWAFYSWGEDWPFASVLTLLVCYYPGYQLNNVNLEGMKITGSN